MCISPSRRLFSLGSYWDRGKNSKVSLLQALNEFIRIPSIIFFCTEFYFRIVRLTSGRVIKIEIKIVSYFVCECI